MSFIDAHLIASASGAPTAPPNPADTTACSATDVVEDFAAPDALVTPTRRQMSPTAHSHQAESAEEALAYSSHINSVLEQVARFGYSHVYALRSQCDLLLQMFINYASFVKDVAPRNGLIFRIAEAYPFGGTDFHGQGEAREFLAANAASALQEIDMCRTELNRDLVDQIHGVARDPHDWRQKLTAFAIKCHLVRFDVMRNNLATACEVMRQRDQFIEQHKKLAVTGSRLRSSVFHINAWPSVAQMTDDDDHSARPADSTCFVCNYEFGGERQPLRMRCCNWTLCRVCMHSYMATRTVFGNQQSLPCMHCQRQHPLYEHLESARVER